jgi:putative chitinase
MARSRIPIPLNGGAGAWTCSGTPGPIGQNDHGDPLSFSLFSDTPGSLGLWDGGDPTLPMLQNDVVPPGVKFARTPGGFAMSLGGQAGLSQENESVVLITVTQLKKLFPLAHIDYLKQVAAELNTDLAKYGLDTALRKAHFFAQIKQEAGAKLSATIENLNYNPTALKEFDYYKMHPEEALTDGYEMDAKKKVTRKANHQAIANKAYANRIGNGSVASGDGYKYRGRGLIQVTGKANYADITLQYAKLYGGGADFLQNPDLMMDFPYSLRSAVCFWISHRLQGKADAGSSNKAVDQITEVINKKTKSYPERREHFSLAYSVFK